MQPDDRHNDFTPVGNETTGEVTYESETPTYLYNAGEQRMKKYEVDYDGYTEMIPPSISTPAARYSTPLTTPMS